MTIAPHPLVLDSTWHPDAPPRYRLVLSNHGGSELRDFRLAVTAPARLTGECEVRGGRLLRVLLGRSGAGTEDVAADDDAGGELSLVIGAGALDDVGGRAEAALGGRLLQGRLPVEGHA